MRVTYCIPTHGGNVKCQQYLFDILYALDKQTNKNFDVVISDQCGISDSRIVECVRDYIDVLNIEYRRCETKLGNISHATNQALAMATGEIKKIMFSDDFILTDNLTEELDKAFTPDVQWCVSGFAHTVDDGKTHYNPKLPVYNDRLLEGVNTLSSPSILALRGDLDIQFDENLTMLMDCDMYYRLYKYHGEPAVLQDYHISNREHAYQTQRNKDYNDLIPEEIEYLKKKHSL